MPGYKIGKILQATKKKNEIFKTFVTKLEHSGIPYCILAGYQNYPDDIPSDVDFMVLPEHISQLPSVLKEAADETGSEFIQFLQHETSACYFVLANQNGQTLSYLYPDACSDYRRKGRLWLSAGDMLARRRKHVEGFYIPAADDAFFYYLIKKIDKGSISEAQGNHLAALFAEAPVDCARRLEDFWPARTVELLKAAAENNAWDCVNDKLKSLAVEMHASSPQETLLSRIRQCLGEIARRIRRIWHPTGLFVVFLGPDGAGKTTVIERVERELAPAFRKTSRFHLRPRLGQKGSASVVVTEPHAKPPRKFIPSLAKLVYLWIDYTVGYFMEVYPRLIRSTLVLFDRYYHDLLVDPKRYRFGGPIWLAKLTGLLIPKPDMWILLDAQPAILQARKKEVSVEETARQRDAYLHLISKLPNGFIVNAEGSIEDVVSSVDKIVLSHMASRCQRRLFGKNIFPRSR